MNNIFCIEKKQEERHWRMLRVSHFESMKQTWNNCKQRNKDIEVEHDDDMLASSESAKIFWRRTLKDCSVLSQFKK